MSQLDPVQIAALEFAEGKQGVGFFIEQGCGKTLIEARLSVRRPHLEVDEEDRRRRLAE